MLPSEKAARPTALVVEDDCVVRLQECETLKQFGFEVIEAQDGERALVILDAFRPDLVLLDVDMPGIDGFEVCRRIRQRWDMTLVPIIMVTGMDDVASINQAYDSGANDFIAKPINWLIFGHRTRYVLRSAQATRKLRELETKQSAMMQAIPDMIFVVDQQGNYLDYKAGHVAEPFFTGNEILGRNMRDVLPPEVAAILQNGIEQAISANQLQSSVYQMCLQDGVHHYEARAVASGPNRAVILVRDITIQKLNEEKIRHLAYFDILTGMPNRLSFLERLERELARARHTHCQIALMFVDLDNFKQVNDTFGHTAGDQLLQSFSTRLKEKLRPSDFIARPSLDEPGALFARLGGDEFTIVLPRVDNSQIVVQVAQRLQNLLRLPFLIGGQEIRVTSSIGVAIFPKDGADAATLLKHADAAMYVAKEQGRNNWQLYDPQR